MVEHRFGGAWTDEKLDALREYLIAYRKIFVANPAAAKLKTIYIDAFAGTGDRTPSDAQGAGDEIRQVKRGSARIALDLPSPFDEYIFIEHNRAHAAQLEAVIKGEYPRLTPRCKVIRADANLVLREQADFRNWRTHRAVAFLDPYGMAVDWVTIQKIAQTKAIDLWVLLPAGSGVMRMLTRRALPSELWRKRLTRFFGTNDWLDHFYKPSAQQALFGEPQQEKVVTFESLSEFFLNRLRTEFAGVAPNARPLLNSRGVPLFYLCFAAANERAASTAIRIANHLLKP